MKVRRDQSVTDQIREVGSERYGNGVVDTADKNNHAKFPLSVLDLETVALTVRATSFAASFA